CTSPPPLPRTCSATPPPPPSSPARRSSDLAPASRRLLVEPVHQRADPVRAPDRHRALVPPGHPADARGALGQFAPGPAYPAERADRKSTRLNSSHVKSSYAVFCLNKKRTHA